ncbi:MAG: DUF2853 family protein [Mangrovicoccus sp.]|nr:DUF2853 family protein [Mangrovicoccus sp.]
MGKRDELVEKYAADLRDKCGVEPDLDLLTKVTAGLGPSAYDADASLVSSSDPEELARVRDNFLIGKLGLGAGPELDEAIAKVVETYGSSERQKFRGVVYYLLTKHFGKETIYG